jgi:PAS domain S-box-containing protein
MMQRLTAVSQRENDPLTIRRGQALALVLLLFLSVTVLQGALDFALRRDLRVALNTAIGLTLFALVYAINRSGRVRLAVLLLLTGGILSVINVAIGARTPVPAIYYLGLVVVIAAAFGGPYDPLVWAAAISFVPLVINLLIYGTPLAPTTTIVLPDGAKLPSILVQELIALSLLWLLAGTAHLASRLLNQLLDESRAATDQAIAANHSLRLSEERFSKVFHASPIAISISTFVDGRCIDLNDSYLAMSGYRREEIVGRTANELQTWADPDDREKVVQTLRTQRSIRDMEVGFRTKSGAIRDLLLSAELVDLNGETCLLSILHDITARKQAEVALRESEERYRLISENTSDLIAIFDQAGHFYYASPSHQQTLGYDPATLIGRPVVDRMHPDDIEPVRQASLQSRAGGVRGASQVTFRYRHADGSWRWLEASAAITVRQDAPFVISVGRDVTERRRLEAQFQQSQKMESIGRLAGGVAHDFNNLLTVMTGYGEIARENLSPADPAREDLGELLKAAERATILTRQLLAFARKQAIEPRVLNLNDLIVDMGRLLRRLIGEDVELIAHPAPDLDQVKVDRGQIEQVIVNLAINARDAMPGGGKLTIETKNVSLDTLYAQQHLEISAGDYVMLAVSDTGVGMDAEVQSHLFEPFFTTKAAGKGTGLGLATCYGIIKQHGGSIGVYSEVGLGTSFKIYLPRIIAPSEAIAQRDHTDGLPRGAETVLLVEDEVSVRALAARVLRVQGYSVIEAANGDEALALIHDQGAAGIDLLLTDVIMPQVGGRELAARLTALLPRLKVLYMSGYTDDAIVHHGRLEPGIVFLVKPFSPGALARKVREVLDT